MQQVALTFAFLIAPDMVFSIASKPIDASANQKLCPIFLGRTKQLVYVTLSITDVHTTGCFAEQFCRVLQVLQPPDALLLLNGHTSWIHRSLERIRPLKFAPAPELNRGQSERQPLRCHGQARMHQHAPYGIGFRSTLETLIQKTEALSRLTVVDEFRCVMQDQDRTVHCDLTGRPESCSSEDPSKEVLSHLRPCTAA
jgi:hypothetical protein